MKKIVAIALLLFGAGSQLSAFCIYNNSGKEIVVIGFKNQGDAKKYLQAGKWTGLIGKIASSANENLEAVAATSPEGAAAQQATQLVGPIAGAAALIVEELVKIYRDTLKPGENSCWNWKDLRNEHGKNREAIYFIILDKAKNNILYQGSVPIFAGLLFDGKAIIAEWPFLNDQGKIVWLTLAEGIEKDYELAKYVRNTAAATIVKNMKDANAKAAERKAKSIAQEAVGDA